MGQSIYKFEETLPEILKMCFSCYRVNGENGKWLIMGNVNISPHTKFTHGLCQDCCKKMKMKVKLITAIKSI